MALLIQTSVSCGSHNLLQCSLLAFPWPKLTSLRFFHTCCGDGPAAAALSDGFKEESVDAGELLPFYSWDCTNTCHYCVVCLLYSGWKEKTAEVDEVSWSLDETISPWCLLWPTSSTGKVGTWEGSSSVVPSSQTSAGLRWLSRVLGL